MLRHFIYTKYATMKTVEGWVLTKQVHDFTNCVTTKTCSCAISDHCGLKVKVTYLLGQDKWSIVAEETEQLYCIM